MPQEFWQGTNLPKVGGFNRAVVLDAIRANGGVSRVELARTTGLTAQTMSNIVRALMDDGLVIEDGHAPSTGGKRRVMLRVVPDAYSSVGLHLDPERITGVLLDLDGRVRLRSQRRVPPGASPEAVVGALARTFHHLVQRSGIDGGRVLGAGLAVPGPLDRTHRRLFGPPNLPGWTEVALADLLEDRTGLPVVMDNDATAAAIGERWAGGADRAGSFVYVYVGTGVGIGVVLGDQVYRGTSSNAGEVGHVPGAGKECTCGKRGCLEAYCSMRAVVAEWAAAGGAADGSVSAAYQRICREAADGDDGAVKILRVAANRLGQTLATVVSVLDVDRVVLGGPALRHAGELIRARVGKVLKAQVWAPHVRPVRVQAALIGEDAGAVGAACLVLDHAYSPRLATLLGG
ncbi:MULTISPECIES: ROK family transcriptional regulator [unclassified Saccharopolyspora]|uniref:ROK family transcriptional regulator n=1 Tax=Saccharopolyspora TaxID=1835 RepID=UPI00190C3270|nr:ROK family transcriptional regulator [Saccharopolyspora sp. HNM0986]MBK0865220.1 ROK family transcriptional regulator [Saccharopolyspora sp. HNM0986]